MPSRAEGDLVGRDQSAVRVHAANATLVEVRATYSWTYRNNEGLRQAGAEDRIVDFALSDRHYTVRVDLVGVRTVVNATSGYNETVEVNRTTWSTINVTLADRQNWTQPYTFQINYTGPWKVQFLLFKAGDLSSTYRELHLYLRIT